MHHGTYRRVGRERLSGLTAVCGGCHKRIHGKQLPLLTPNEVAPKVAKINHT